MTLEELKEKAIDILRSSRREYLQNPYDAGDYSEADVDDILQIFIQFCEKNNAYILGEIPDNETWHKDERLFEAYCAGKNDVLRSLKRRC